MVMERHHHDNTESRLVRVETELKNALRELERSLREITEQGEEIVKHDERIDRHHHDIKHLRAAHDGAKIQMENIGRAAHDLIAEERRARREEMTAAIEKISVTLEATEERRRKAFDRRLQLIGRAAWAIALIVFTAYVGTLFAG
jgi:chromosome segregation ATPase